jgi:hypothetical protein
MSDAPATSEAVQRFVNEYSSWFTSLDATAKAAIDEMFRLHPEDMYRALTGEQAPENLPRADSLSDILNPEGAMSGIELVPYYAAEVTIEPSGPEANTEFTIRWTDTNYGAASQGHSDQVEIINYDTGESVFTGDRVEVDALAANASANQEIKVPGLPAGNYSVRVSVNVDGSYDPNEATRDAGIAGMAERVFGVGGFDPTRPATPEQANTEAVGNALFYLLSMSNTGEEAKAQEYLAQALQSYAGVLPAGTTADDDLMPRILQAATTVRGLEIADPAAFQQAIAADAAATAQVIQQVEGLSVTPAQGAEALLDLADKAGSAAG